MKTKFVFFFFLGRSKVFMFAIFFFVGMIFVMSETEFKDFKHTLLVNLISGWVLDLSVLFDCRDEVVTLYYGLGMVNIASNARH